MSTDGHLISGTWNGTTSNQNQFYDLEILKTVATGQYVSIANNVNVNALGSLSFTSNFGIIRTDASSHADDGSAYANELYLQNPTNAKFSGYSTGNGAITKYIEGKLRRQINNTGAHFFPIGVAPASLDGMEAFDLNFTANPNNNFLGLIKPATTAPLHRNIVCDVGQDPTSAVANPFTDCIGGPDGILDLYILESSNDLSHEWVVTPTGSTTGYAYGITMYPGSVLDPDTYYTIPNACSTPYQTQRLRILAKNGKPGGDVSSGPFSPFPFAHLTCYGYCAFDNADLNISLNNQTSFSSFRIHGTINQNSTALPVELLSFTAKAIKNQYIQLDWITASETNNYGFEIYRSTDAVNFNKIGFVAGNGNSSIDIAYQFDDKDVVVDIVYYYKLKQIDFDQKYQFSRIEKAQLKGNNLFSISEIYPNPSNSDAYIDIYSPTESEIKLDIYNPLGQNMKIYKQALKEGVNKIKIESNDLATGSYIVRLNHNTENFTKKLIKK
ncbi:MAG: T9SS type A sorting domain-containing protein [Sphingobacteriales bacterium]|nr:MAG: T9SS type A sorting domain-containing protein [Sphingobacteriales bacterium]